MEFHRSPKLKISLLIRNTIISDKTNIREFVWEIVFQKQYVAEIKKFQTFLLHLLVSCMSICLLVEYGAILSIIHRDINNRSSPTKRGRRLEIMADSSKVVVEKN